MTIFKTIILLICISFSATFAADTTPDETAVWKRALVAISIGHEETITELNVLLKGKSAPKAFATVVKKNPEEEEEKFKERKLAALLLQNAGWEAALFFCSRLPIFQKFCVSSDVPLELRRSNVRSYITGYTVETAAKNGQVGAVLCLLSPSHIGRTDDYALQFANGLLRHCQVNGFSDFAAHVFANQAAFFKGSKRLEGQIELWKAHCFAVAFTQDLISKDHSDLESDGRIEIFLRLNLERPDVDHLYAELAKRSKHSVMDRLLTESCCPKPSKAVENFALSLNLQHGCYDRVRQAFTTKPGTKPNKNIVDSFVAQKIKEGNWTNAESIIDLLYTTRVIFPSQGLTDYIYVCAAAYENRSTLALLDGENWPHKPTEQARKNAFSHACMNDRDTLSEEFIARFSTPEELRHALVETVKYRKQSQFDTLLDTHRTQLSEYGMRSALEQAGKRSEKRQPLSIFSTLDLDYLLKEDNHYQKRLKELLGIKPKSFLDSFTLKDLCLITATDFKTDSSTLFNPRDLATADYSKFFVPSVEGTPAPVTTDTQ